MAAIDGHVNSRGDHLPWTVAGFTSSGNAVAICSHGNTPETQVLTTNRNIMTKAEEQIIDLCQKTESFVDKIRENPDSSNMEWNAMVATGNAAEVGFLSMKEKYRKGWPVEKVTSFELWLEEHHMCREKWPEEFTDSPPLTEDDIEMFRFIHFTACQKFSHWLSRQRATDRDNY